MRPPDRPLQSPAGERVKPEPRDVRRLLVVLPSWVGDVVMATPTLRALRELYPDAKITYLAKSYVRPLVDGSPWHDRVIVVRPRRKKDGAADRPRPSLQARLKRRKFDAVVLLTNSFRSALMGGLAGIPRRVGYDRDGRGILLTDRLIPMRHDGKFVPTPLVDYYLGVARYMGAEKPSRTLELFTRAIDDKRAEQILMRAAGPIGGAPLVMLNPGAANHGDIKLWPAERYAAVADALVERHGAVVLVNGSPRDRAVTAAVHKAARHELIDLPRFAEKSRIEGLSLLKSMLRRCDLLISNDTGARHVGVAMGTAVVSLFGPTDPEWTRLDYPREMVLRRAEDCPGCRAHKRGVRHRCMSALSVERVLDAAEKMLASRPLWAGPRHG